VYAAPFLPNLHVGYSVVALSMVPILLVTAWVFQPSVAARATDDGFVSRDETVSVADD
jgi:NNP family nitrate/nitrite transporter-like MFS transporter